LDQTGEYSESDRYGKGSDGRNSNTEHLKRRKEKQKAQKEETKNKIVQIIQNMVLGSIKFEPVSLFTTILSNIKLSINFSQDYIFLTCSTIIS
jgi:hypothetical protein